MDTILVTQDGAIAEQDGNISATAKQLGTAMQTLSNWDNKASQGKLAGTAQYDPDLMVITPRNKAAQATT